MLRMYRNIGGYFATATKVTPPLISEWVSNPFSFNYIAYGNGVYVGMSSSGYNERMFISRDGFVWEKVIISDPYNYFGDTWEGIAFGNGKFVAVGGYPTNGTPRVMVSEDGLNWNFILIESIDTYDMITFGNGQFVAIGTKNGGYDKIVSKSVDGINWTNIPLKISNYTYSIRNTRFYDITYANGIFVAVGHDNDLTVSVIRSVDAINWTYAYDPLSYNSWGSITYGNNEFVTVAFRDDSRLGNGIYFIMSSPDAITWTRHKLEPRQLLSSIAYTKGNYYLTSNGGGKLYTSKNLDDWKEIPKPSGGSNIFINGDIMIIGNKATRLK